MKTFTYISDLSSKDILKYKSTIKLSESYLLVIQLLQVLTAHGAPNSKMGATEE